MKKIFFENFKHMDDRIDFNVKIIEDEEVVQDDEIFLEFDRELKINDNVMAVALSTLCGMTFDYIYFDLDINEDLLKDISLFTKGEVASKSTNNLPYLNNNKDDKIIINFSGGMDSLAAYLILPKNISEIVSIDFNILDREKTFFKKFKPYTLRTNFRELGYNRNTWQFMGIGSILFNELINAKYQLFGTIMETGVGYSFEKYATQKQFPCEPFSFIGIQDLKIIQGITEIGTTLIICKLAPHLVNDSLISLAPPETTKRYRKELIVKILMDKLDLDNIFIEYSGYPKEGSVLKWGDKFLNDFLTLYWVKNADMDDVIRITKDIPQEVIDFVETRSLNFYEKFNTNYLNNIPDVFKEGLIKNLTKAEIYPYDETDFRELNEVMIFLSNYHPEILSRL